MGIIFLSNYISNLFFVINKTNDANYAWQNGNLDHVQDYLPAAGVLTDSEQQTKREKLKS